MTSLDERIAARPAPKVTPERLEAVMVSAAYHRLTPTLTVCVLSLANGFTVTGESACASPENYDQDIGEQLALADAKRKVWALEGYALRNKLALLDEAVVGARAGMGRYVGTKVINATPLSRGDYCALRGWEVPAKEDAADAGYLVEYTDKIDRNVPGYEGYVSWSPADVFQRAYEQVDGVSTKPRLSIGTGKNPLYRGPDMDFGQALDALKEGSRVARAGWNGSGMFAYLVPAASYPVQTGAAKAHFGDGALVPYRAYLALKTADDDVATWAPSVSDVLATDWFVVE